jgi:regulator of sigma E protease
MSSLSLMHTVFYFLLALAILIAIHEYGHYIVARRLGVKVLRFSIGVGKSVWRRQSAPDATEFSVGILPLGGYVKMADEREGEVAPRDLPRAFNRQSVAVRSAIVAAGPVANFLLAVLLFWLVFMIGETGVRPLLGPVDEGTLAYRGGFVEGDEILSVDGESTPTWSLAIGALLEQAMDHENLEVDVRAADGSQTRRLLNIPRELSEKPELLSERLGFQTWRPDLPPVIESLEPGGAAEAGGLAPGDWLLSVDGTPIADWRQWVEHVRAHPGVELNVLVERGGERVPLKIAPAPRDTAKGKIGHIGAAVRVPEDLMASMTVEYRLDAWPALGAAISKTFDYSAMTLKMMGRMVIGRASVENLSGPISIAQYAGHTARMGLTPFLKFLALVSVSLAVLNLLPIPVLDGGHLMFFLVEAIQGKPLPERAQAMFQQFGVFLLLSLMALAFYLDIGRLLS